MAAAIIGPAAVFLAAAGRPDLPPPTPESTADSFVEGVTPATAVEIVALAPTVPLPALQIGQVSQSSGESAMIAASRYRTVDRTLPVGLAPERGLQVKTILTSRAISAAFPEIRSIGGMRPDALRWHPNGLALDVMIPNAGTPQGIALGNEIVSYVMRNAARFGMQDCIWRGVYYTPNGGQRGGGYGHYDHVHITTTGGGYPTGGEVYYR